LLEIGEMGPSVANKEPVIALIIMIKNAEDEVF
jgi:hypothetical protein